MKPKSKLTKLKINEISSVDVGANDGARVMFWKKENDMDINELVEKQEKLEAEINAVKAEKEELAKKLEALEVEKASDESGDDDIAADVSKQDETLEKDDMSEEKLDAVSKADFEAIQKANEELAEKVAKMEAEKEFSEFAKQAETELPNLAGSAEEKGTFLKALHGMDKEARDTIMSEMKKADKIVGSYFVAKGSVGKSADDPETKLEMLAKNYAEKHDVNFAKAYDEVCKTEEGKELYAQTLPN